jgi:hypothetical protein
MTSSFDSLAARIHAASNPGSGCCRTLALAAVTHDLAPDWTTGDALRVPRTAGASGPVISLSGTTAARAGEPPRP